MSCRRSRGDLDILPNLFCFVNTFFYFFQFFLTLTFFTEKNGERGI